MGTGVQVFMHACVCKRVFEEGAQGGRMRWASVRSVFPPTLSRGMQVLHCLPLGDRSVQWTTHLSPWPPKERKEEKWRSGNYVIYMVLCLLHYSVFVAVQSRASLAFLLPPLELPCLQFLVCVVPMTVLSNGNHFIYYDVCTSGQAFVVFVIFRMFNAYFNCF